MEAFGMGIREDLLNMQDVINQQQLMALQQQMSQRLVSLGNLGGMAQGLMGANQIGSYTQQIQIKSNSNPVALGDLYPGKVIYHDDGVPRLQEISIPGWKYDCDKGGYVDVDGHFISKRDIEDGIPLELSIKKAVTPNICWLDERVEEMRVKL
jgi:hypothetical protein